MTNRVLIILALVIANLPGAAANAVERVYFIQAEEVVWDYAPSYPVNRMTGRSFTDAQNVFVGDGEDVVGRQYVKAVFRGYTDMSFTEPVEHPDHLGILGPIIRAEVGDSIVVHFRNATSMPSSIHPHGVFYDKKNEGAPYADGDDNKADDIVKSGESFTYRWDVPERAGPGPADPSSIAWPYHSHVDEPADTNAGLVGAMIVTRKGDAGPDGAPTDVDREFVTLFTVFDENTSRYAGENITRFTSGGIDPEDEVFAESNLMHAMNGLLYGNLGGLVMKVGERVRWHVFALGTEVDLHTPHWHASTLLQAGRRVDVTELMPASVRTLDMRPDSPGTWMYHCHVNDHLDAGMMALYTVEP